MVRGEERNDQLSRYANERRFLRHRSDPFGISDTQFVELFRLSKNMVRYLIDILTPHISSGGNALAIPRELRVLATLEFYATGTYQRVIRQNFVFPIAQSTMLSIVTEISELICDQLAEEWIQFPTDEETIIRNKNRFIELSRFPGTTGAVDCTHIAILVPTVEE